MNAKFLKNIMSCPSCSGHEEYFRNCIESWLRTIGVTNVKKDGKGNLYVTKGKPASGEMYVCVCNHMDTVHHKVRAAADAHQRVEVQQEGDKLFCDGFGVGADDKAGCAIQLDMIQRCPVIKAVFFVEEEIGMQGSKNCDVSFFDDVCFIISFDSPEKNRAAKASNGVPLFTDEVFEAYIQPVASKHGVTNFRSEPYTDVSQLTKRLSIQSCNFGNGGYNPHSDTEYLKISECMDAADMGVELLQAIPKDKKLTITYKEPTLDYSSWWSDMLDKHSKAQYRSSSPWKGNGVWGSAFRKGEAVQQDLPGMQDDYIDVDAKVTYDDPEVDDVQAFKDWLDQKKEDEDIV